MDKGAAAPTSCKLDGSGFRARIAWIADLNLRALRAARRDDLRLGLDYASSALADVSQMVDQERECCGFLTFELVERGETVTLAIMAPEAARDVADMLFGPFQDRTPQLHPPTAPVDGAHEHGGSETEQPSHCRGCHDLFSGSVSLRSVLRPLDRHPSRDAWFIWRLHSLASSGLLLADAHRGLCGDRQLAVGRSPIQAVGQTPSKVDLRHPELRHGDDGAGLDVADVEKRDRRAAASKGDCAGHDPVGRASTPGRVGNHLSPTQSLYQITRKSADTGMLFFNSL